MDYPFPRKDDGLGYAWGLQGDRPEKIWERFSDLYEEQAEALWQCFEELGLIPALEWAGSQDGEAVIGRNIEGDIVVLFHLEEPECAEVLHRALAQGRIALFVRRSIRELASQERYMDESID